MATIKIDLEFPRFPVERKIFGHFTEHAFGNIYGGMYDPESPKADEDITADVVLPGFDFAGKTITAKVITADDLNAANTLENPDRVSIADAAAPEVTAGGLSVTLGRHSVNLIKIS